MWTRRCLTSVAALLSIVAIFTFVNNGHVAASTGINQNLNFEGKIVNSSGLNIADGTYNMEFKVYDATTGCTPSTGTGCHLSWTEDWLVGSSEGGITFSSGTYDVNLGATCPFSGGSCETYTNTAINWNSYPLYLSLQIGNTTSCTIPTTFTLNCGGDTEMKPYILLTSTPYSENSSELGGYSAAAFAQLSAANTFQPTALATGITALQTSTAGSADIFDVETNNTNPVIQVTGPSDRKR